MRICFDKPAHSFNEAMPLGNGRLGAMVYGLGVYALNEATLYSGKPIDDERSDEMFVHMDFIKDGLYAYKGRFSRKSKIFKEQLKHVKTLIINKQYSRATTFANEWLQGSFSQSFMPFGFLRFRFFSNVLEYYRELDLIHLLHSERFMLDGACVRIHTFMKDNSLEIELESTCGIDFELRFEGDLLQTSFFNNGCFVAYGKCPSYASVYREDESVIFEENEGIGFLGGIKLVCCDGKLFAKSTHLYIKDCKKFHISLNIISGFLGFDTKPLSDARFLFGRFERSFAQENPRLSPIKSFLRTNRECLRHDVATLRDKIIILFNYGIYLYHSASKSEPMNLQGLWNESVMAAWSSNYTTNINLEMNYWIAPFLGSDENIEPLVRMCEELCISGGKVASEFYNARGWCCHHNSDIWRHAYPSGNGAQHTLWCFASAWLVLTLCRFIRFNPLSKLKGRIENLLLPTCLFYVDIVSERDGIFHTLPSTSPENFFKDPQTGEMASIAKSSALDISLLRELFTTACNIIDKNTSHYQEIMHVLSHLAPHQINEMGEIAEWFEADLLAFDKNHRHLSHLYDLYPGNFFYKDERLLKAAIKSLESRGLGGTGWSLVWKIAIYARLKRIHEIKILLKKLCQNIQSDVGIFNHILHSHHIDFIEGGGMYDNCTIAHPPFQIDACLGISAALMELFIQTHQGFIEILPCYFDDLGEGELKNFRLEGGICFDLSFGAEDFILELKADFEHERQLCYGGYFKTIKLTTERMRLTKRDFDESF